MNNILHFGDLRLKSGINHYYGDLYVIGAIYEDEKDDSTLIVDGNLYVSKIAYLKELKVSGSIYANEISCTTCHAVESIYVETDLDAVTVIAGESIYVEANIFAESTVACFDSIYASYIESPEIRTTFIECKDLRSVNITGDTLTVNGPLVIDYSLDENINISLSKIRSSNINIG